MKQVKKWSCIIGFLFVCILGELFFAAGAISSIALIVLVILGEVNMSATCVSVVLAPLCIGLSYYFGEYIIHLPKELMGLLD